MSPHTFKQKGSKYLLFFAFSFFEREKIFEIVFLSICGLVAKLCPILVTPWTSLPAPLSMGFPRQEYWSGLPCPPPGDLPNPGIEPMSPTLQASYLPTEPMVAVPTSCVYIIDRLLH